MTITVNNQQVEAYDLLLKKEFALDIIEGRKKVEIRSFSDYYISRFLDKKIMAQNDKAGLKPFDDGYQNEFRQDIHYIHFHNYNNTWFVDVEIEGIGMCVMDSQDIEPLVEDFPEMAEYLPDARKNDELPEEDKPMIFYIVLADIIAHNL